MDNSSIILYCELGGGTYYINDTGSYCIINGTYFDALQYYENNVPPQYSFCTHYGLIYLNSTYCEYPNGTLISPYSLIPSNNTYPYISILIDLNSLQNLINLQNQTPCNSLLNCSNTPWNYQPCSNQIYPCFNPPYIPSLYLTNSTLYQDIISAYQQEAQCGYCPENLSFQGDWFRCPYNYSLNQLYKEFLQQCPPPNIVYISCTGVFECINQTEINLTSYLENNSQQLVYVSTITSNGANSNNVNLVLPAIIIITIVIIGLIVLLYYIK
jgi:hypothetical protein